MSNTKQPTFEEKLDAMWENFGLKNWMLRDDVNKAIKDLILSDVVGEDELEDVDLSKKSNTRKAIRSWNRHRAEQRSIINGSK